MRGSQMYGRNSRKSVFGYDEPAGYLDEIQEKVSERSSINPYNDNDYDLEDPGSGDKIRLTSTRERESAKQAGWGCC